MQILLLCQFSKFDRLNNKNKHNILLSFINFNVPVPYIWHLTTLHTRGLLLNQNIPIVKCMFNKQNKHIQIIPINLLKVVLSFPHSDKQPRKLHLFCQIIRLLKASCQHDILNFYRETTLLFFHGLCIFVYLGREFCHVRCCMEVRYALLLKQQLNHVCLIYGPFLINVLIHIINLVLNSYYSAFRLCVFPAIMKGLEEYLPIYSST